MDIEKLFSFTGNFISYCVETFIKVLTLETDEPEHNHSYTTHLGTQINKLQLTDHYQEDFSLSFAKLISQHFDQEELKFLCFSLGVDFDDLISPGKTNKAMELVKLFERCNKTHELLKACKYLRPNVLWSDNPLTEQIKSRQVIFNLPKGTTWDNKANSLLDSRLLGYMFVAFFVGAVINALIPGRKATPENLMVASALTMLNWLLHSCLLFLFCKALKGTGTFKDGLSVSLRLYATIYVFSSFAGLVFGAFVSLWPVTYSTILQTEASFITMMKIGNPFAIYFLVQFILLAIYLPLYVRKTYNIGWKQVVIYS